VHEALERVGLASLASRPFGTLSGGQQQRAFLARALVQEPDLLVLDEPAAGVDDENRARIGKLLTELRGQRLPMLIATHDVEELRPLEIDGYWCLARGRLSVEPPDTPHQTDRHGSPGSGEVEHGHGSRPEPGLLGLDRRPPATI
jgi:ABC-type Mn2+/Zn2+ transport system ATPase subunit